MEQPKDLYGQLNLPWSVSCRVTGNEENKNMRLSLTVQFNLSVVLSFGENHYKKRLLSFSLWTATKT